MVAILLGADNGFFYAGQIMHISSHFTVILFYLKQCYAIYIETDTENAEYRLKVIGTISEK